MWRTLSATEAVTGVGCWSQVTEAVLSSCVTEPGLTTKAWKVTVSEAPAESAQLDARLGGVLV